MPILASSTLIDGDKFEHSFFPIRWPRNSACSSFFCAILAFNSAICCLHLPLGNQIKKGERDRLSLWKKPVQVCLTNLVFTLYIFDVLSVIIYDSIVCDSKILTFDRMKVFENMIFCFVQNSFSLDRCFFEM